MTLATAFSGIDMFALGLGEEPVWQAELEPFPAQITKLRYPDAIQLGDVKTIDEAPAVDEFAFGFPCQDLSRAGRNAGLHGERSTLWFEGLRLVTILQPERVYIENVTDLLYKGMCAVVEGLTDLGYSVEWDCIPAAAMGAPHLRDRLWIVAHRKPVPYVFGPAAGLFPRQVTERPKLKPGVEDKGWMKWPRAGFTRKPGMVQELQPIAPLRVVKRRAVLLPVDQGDAAAPAEFLPTPVADDVKGDVVGHLRNKNGWDTGRRVRITSLAVLARNGFEQPSEEQLAEAHRTAGDTDRARESGWIPTPMKADAERSSEQGVRHYAEGTDNPTLLGYARRFPTPTVQDAHNDGGPSQHDRNTPPLNAHVKLWPTPKAEPSGPDFAREGRPRSGGDDLVTAVERDRRQQEMWPTPHGMPKQGQPRNPGPSGNELGRAVNESLRVPTPRATDGDKRNRGDLIAHAKGRPNKHHMVPTPTSSNRDNAGGTNSRKAARARGEYVSGQLNPDWVEWLMGCPVGWTNPAVPNEDLVLHSWAHEPEDVPRVIENMPDRVNRLSALGNALVPQIPAFIASRARR